MNISHFGRVVAWDPNRTDGCRSSRVEEFREEDLFLETDLFPDESGRYSVPAASNGLGCIGLQWVENRSVKYLALGFVGGAPSVDGVRVECWTGISAWQGNWIPLKGRIERRGSRWMFSIDWKENLDAKQGTRKIRWILPASAMPVSVKRLVATGPGRYETVDLLIEIENPTAGQTGEIEVYNGEVVGSAEPKLTCMWDMTKPLELSVRDVRPRRIKSDRTVLRFRLPSGSFGVAVEDILQHGCVYVRDAGVFITTEGSGLSLADYRNKIAGKKMILERVREMPDQTLAQAMAKTRNPIQDNGPIMLSLACDNRKFVVNRDGSILFAPASDAADRMEREPVFTSFARLHTYLIQPRFGSGSKEHFKRRLDPPDLPVTVIETEDDGVVYTQRAYTAPYGNEYLADAPDWICKRPLCVVEFTVTNPGSRPANASLALEFLADREARRAAEVVVSESRAVVKWREQFIASMVMSEIAPLEASVEGGVVTLTGTLEPKAVVRCFIYIPGWNSTASEQSKLVGSIDLLPELAAYWERVLAPAIQMEIPDNYLMNVIRMQQIHCLIAARCEDMGKRVAPWIGAVSYGPLESEANSIIYGMDLLGHAEFARRSLDFFIECYNARGFLTTGYTMLGTGWHLWMLGEYYERTKDSEWLARVAPEVARVCKWIDAQRRKTMKLDARGEKLPVYGLVPPGVLADWTAFAYHFCLNAHYYAGLKHAADALAAIGYPGADALAQDADEFREDILRAYRWAQARMPVYKLKNDAWIRGYPAQMGAPGPTNDFFPSQDSNRSWCYDVELGAHQLVTAGILDPNSAEISEMLDHMEDVQFLHDGSGEYPAEKNEQDWFNLGGFAKVQPFYCRNAEIYAMRDDVKPFIRSYFNALASLLNTETLWLWEHFHNIAAWNKTHETGYFLQQTRFMLVMEHGDELWLAPLISNNWLEDGMHVAARNAPTKFGKVSYVIASHVGQGYIEAEVQPPTRSVPSGIVIRFRHPNGKRMKSVTVNGEPCMDFDAEREIVRVKPVGDRIVVRADYRPRISMD